MYVKLAECLFMHMCVCVVCVCKHVCVCVCARACVRACMQFICTEESDADEVWHSADTDSDYMYGEEWVAGADTKLEDLPQAQPYGQNAALIPRFALKVHIKSEEIACPTGQT